MVLSYIFGKVERDGSLGRWECGRVGGFAAGSAVQHDVDSKRLCAVGRREGTATGNSGFEEKPEFALAIPIVLHHDFALEPSV